MSAGKFSPGSARAELLTEHNARRINNFAHARDNMPFAQTTLHGLDGALTPLAHAVHAALFNLRANDQSIAITGEWLQSHTFHGLRNAAKAFADLESTRPTNRGHNKVMDQTLASFDAINAAVEKLGQARALMLEAVAEVAKTVDELTDVVSHRRYEIFTQAVLDAAVVAEPLPGSQKECYLCLEPVPANGAAWIAGPPCQCSEHMQACRPCFVRAVFELTDCGRKTHAHCPHCRAEFAWKNVRITGEKSQ